MASTMIPIKHFPASRLQIRPAVQRVAKGAFDTGLAAIAICFALGAIVGGWVHERRRLLALFLTKRSLTSEQFDALADLVMLQLKMDESTSAFFPDSLDGSAFDTCTLRQTEIDALKRCAAARVPHALIKRLAPDYYLTSVYPQPAS